MESEDPQGKHQAISQSAVTFQRGGLLSHV